MKKKYKVVWEDDNFYDFPVFDTKIEAEDFILSRKSLFQERWIFPEIEVIKQ